MSHDRLCHVLFAVVALMVGGSSGRAQVGSTPVVPADDGRGRSSAEATLSHPVSITLREVPLGEALDNIAAAANVRISYSPSQLPAAAKVSLRAQGLPLGDVLTDVLAGTGLEFKVSAIGRIRVRPAGSTGDNSVLGMVQGTATISGYVRDSATGAAIPQATVRIEGTTLETKAKANGQYQITGVATGEYRVTARRIGYVAITRTLTVSDGRNGILNFGLNPPATRLDEVVTTALGEQRRYQVGNVISTINVDSVAPTSPVTSVTDLISGRVPGVVVMENSGLVGSGEAIRIRGVSSLVLQSDPIVIVDGVRENSTPGQIVGIGSRTFDAAGVHTSSTRLNDIAFDDIATIDVLKGPAATTEYGTDAANGVIVITTKHGSSASPLWHMSGEQTSSDLPRAFPETYYSWGHTTDGSRSPSNCTLQVAPDFGGGVSTQGTCVVDSITQFNPLNNSATTIFGTGMRQKYDLSVGGGSEALRYYIAGAMSNENGVLRVPPVLRSLANNQQLTLPPAAYNANTEQQRSIHLNTIVKVGSAADMSMSASYLTTDTREPDAQALLAGAEDGPAIDNASGNYGYYAGAQLGAFPLGELAMIATDYTQRTTGGVAASWRPTGWFVAHVTVGIDHGSNNNQSVAYPLGSSPAALTYGNGYTQLAVGSSTSDIYDFDLRVAATANITELLKAVTSAGIQGVDNRLVGQGGTVTGITLANLTLDGYPNTFASQTLNEIATLGGYVEEQLGVNDRLFLIGALRVDGASGFGNHYAVAAYPKATVSWLVLNTGETSLRLRGAFGESGVQPQNGASQLLYTAVSSYVDGVMVSGENINWPGNPNLRPERSEEFEGGADVGLWSNRLALEFTMYEKATDDALVNQQLGGDVCCYTFQENLGRIQNGGLEVSAILGIVQSRSLTWNVALNASGNQNKLVSLAPGVLLSGSAANPNQNRVGYPLYGFWATRTAYLDANYDGIIETNEVSYAASETYMGPDSPTREASMQTYVGFWRGMVSLGLVMDYRGGYRIWNDVAVAEDESGSSAPANLVSAPAWEQARTAASSGLGGTFYGVPVASNFEDGSFVRLREISLTYAVPRHFMRSVRWLNGASLTAAVRNLVLWTRYTGVDPEVNNVVNEQNQTNVTPGGATTEMYNNDIRADGGAVPLLRDFVIRLNVGLK